MLAFKRPVLLIRLRTLVFVCLLSYRVCSLCSFPTRQAAHDYIVQHRLALARHYLRDSKFSPSELEASAAADGCQDEYYLVSNLNARVDEQLSS